MRLFRRWLCIFLVFVMVLGMVPMTARAEEVAEETVAEEQIESIPETAEQPEPEVTEASAAETTEVPEIQEKGEVVHIPFQLNPLYEGIYTADDFPSGEQDPVYQGELYAATTYLTVEQAAAIVRTGMKNRQESITVSFKTTTSDRQTAGEELIAEALKHTGNALEGDYLRWQYGGWSASMSRRYNYLTEKYEYDCTFRITYYTTAQQEKELTTAINQLKNSLLLYNKSTYDKIYAVYDYICQNITYDYDNLNDSSYKLKHTAYAALVNKTAVCQGYAVLFYRIMLELGIDCRLIAGLGNGGAHGWNIVKLNGLYYNLDSTWDAGYDEYIWFLNSFWDFGGHERDMEYDTIAFHNKYPIAAESYEKGVTGTKDPYISAGYAGAETDNVIWYLGRDGSITFKGEGAIYDFNTGNQQPYYGYWEDEITKVVVEEGITSLGSYSFYKFPALEEVVLSSTVTEIRSNAFAKCSSLTGVEFSFANVKLGKDSFFNCDSMTEVQIHAGMTLGEGCFANCNRLERVWIDCVTVPREAFDYCTALIDLTLTDRVTTIGEGAFRDCDSLTEVVIPESVTSLTGFALCDNLTSVTLPENLIEIGKSCFYGCKKLEKINLPESLQIIGSEAFFNTALTQIDLPENIALHMGAFSSCDNLTEVRIHEGVAMGVGCFEGCGSLRSVWIDIPTVPMEAFEFCHSLREITLTDNVTAIGKNAFRNCDSLTEVVIPETVTWLSGFAECDNLVSINLPKNLTTLGEYCFSECKKLEKITLPEGLQTIDIYAFQKSGLTQIDIPASVTVKGNAFYQCEALSEMWIHEGVNLERRCFTDCTGLESVWIDCAFIPREAFSYCNNLTDLTLTNRVTTIESGAFSGCDSLTEVVIPKSITSLSGFAYCENLSSVTLPDNLTEIGGGCFSGCGKLEMIDLPEGLLTIGDSAFRNCGLTQIHIPESVTKIEDNAFGNCNNLTDVVIPPSVTYLSGFQGCENLERVELNNTEIIGRGAFRSCRKLSNIDIPEGITEIQNEAFQYCNSLTHVTIPQSVIKLNAYAFNGCQNLESVILNNSGALSAFVFAECRKLTSVTVGENITSIDLWTFDKCSALKEITFLGDAPSIHTSAFKSITATAHYPMIASWTEDKLQNYGGNITWVGYSVCTEHEYSAVVTAPTCIEQGFTTYTCTICGESYVGDEVEATGHSYEATVADPTCTKKGFTTYTCSVCGDSYADDYVDALGHKFEDEICTVCGRPQRIPGDIDGNDIVDVDDVLALLWHVLFPEDYPVDADADFDGNGMVDVDDVLALLWHVLFPEDYPL